MDAHLQYPTGINHLQLPVKSSVAHAYSVESSCQGRQVSQYQGELPRLKEDKPGSGTSTWSSIKSLPRNISIFCRAVGKVSLVAYYFVKHHLFRVQFTSQHLQSYLQRLGSAYPKVLQAVVENPRLLKELGKELGKEWERKQISAVIQHVLANNPEIPVTVPRSILDKAGCKAYSVERHIETGTIRSCFEIKKDEESLVAKVVPDWKANDLAAGLKSIRMLLFFMPKEIRMAIREMTNPLIRQCNLKEEKKNQAAFKEALEQTEQTVRLDTLLPQATQLTFRVPKITEAVDADNLLIMEHLQDGHALNTLTNPQNQRLRSDVYQRCFGVHLVEDDLFKSVLDKVHFQVQKKWCELALGHGIVHGDCHPGNIMLSFKPGGHIYVWFNDFGHCITLTEAQRTQYPDIVHLLSSLADPFTPEAMDHTRLDRLVDTLWDEVAISHRANTPAHKLKFKNRLSEEFTKIRDLDLVLNRLADHASFSPEQKAQLRADCETTCFQREMKVIWLSIISACLGAVCQLEGIQLPSSFTRYISAYFRADVILD